MTHLPPVDPATAPAPVPDLLAEVHGRLGGTPNMTRSMANSPALLKGWLDLSGALTNYFNKAANVAIDYPAMAA